MSVGLILSLYSTAFAEDNNNSITEKEKNILIEKVGLTQEELSLYNVSLLREMISNNAIKLTSGQKIRYNLNSEGAEDGGFSTQALSASDIELWGNAYEVTSDIPNRKKFLLIGTFHWLVEPVWNLTDKMSIGYPVTNEWYLNTSGGQVLGHTSQMCNYIGYNECVNKTTPSDHDLGVGVAAAFDLKGTATDMRGYVQQYVYTQKSTGSSNVLFRYGHKTLTGNVGVSITNVGLSVEPAFNTETRDYPITFSW